MKFRPDAVYNDPNYYTAYHNDNYGYSDSEESASSMNISSNMITYTSQGAKRTKARHVTGQYYYNFTASETGMDGCIISDPTYMVNVLFQLLIVRIHKFYCCLYIVYIVVYLVVYLLFRLLYIILKERKSLWLRFLNQEE